MATTIEGTPMRGTCSACAKTNRIIFGDKCGACSVERETLVDKAMRDTYDGVNPTKDLYRNPNCPPGEVWNNWL